MPIRLATRCRKARGAGILLLALLLHGCALIVPQTVEMQQSRPAGLAERVELESVPFFPQSDYQCGPAALATGMASYGTAVTPEELVGQVYLPARQGSLQVEMLAAPRRYGMVSYRLAPRFEDLLREVAAGNPVVVLQDYGARPFSVWHYAVVAGYDQAKEELVLRSGIKRRLLMPFAIHEYLWRTGNYWAMVAVPPERIPATAGEARYLEAVAALERLGDARASRAAYAAFLQRWPDNLAAGIGLANAHYALGELADAERVLRRAAERHPDSAVVLNNLAQTVSDQGRHAEALPLVDRALGLAGPYAAAAGETRGEILRRLEKSP